MTYDDMLVTLSRIRKYFEFRVHRCMRDDAMAMLFLWQKALDLAIDMLKAQQSREHGQWIDIPDKPDWDQKMCSICGDYFCCQLNYCPNCGALMNGCANVNKEDGA